MKPTKKISAAVSEEMKRLAKISPLLSPTVGWPKLKGLQTVQSQLNLTFITKVDPALNSDKRKLWTVDENPSLRSEISRARRGLMTTVSQLANGAMKAAGWKLKKSEHKADGVVAMLWTRKGREAAILSYLDGSAPSDSWVNVKMTRSFKSSQFFGPNAYGGEAVFIVAARKPEANAVGDICASIQAKIQQRLGSRNLSIPFESPTHRLNFGLPQVHLYSRSTQSDNLPVQHRKLIDSLRGKVSIVGFANRRDTVSADTPNYILVTDGIPSLGAEQAWNEMSAMSLRGSIRLVAVDDQGRTKWCETFGPDETVPKATIKRLLASSHLYNTAHVFEQEAIYHSLKQAE